MSPWMKTFHINEDNHMKKDGPKKVEDPKNEPQKKTTDNETKKKDIWNTIKNMDPTPPSPPGRLKGRTKY